MQAVAVAELEVQFAMLRGVTHGDTEFLEGFAQGSGERRLARVDLAAGSVDLARAEAAFFADEENLPVAHDEEKVGALLRLPGCPVDHVAR
jgi:hypothetical protein